MTVARAVSILLFCAAPTLAQSSAPTKDSAPAESPIRGFDPILLDTTTAPCVDFYQYACGGWLARNEIPPDQSRWTRFQQLAERNRDVLRGILEGVAAPDSKRDAVDQKIGDYYASCMDEQSVDAAGLSPLKPELDRIDAVKTVADMRVVLARLHALGVPAFFAFGSGQDFKDATQVIAEADQGGLGLPDRDYYLKTDAKSAEQRAQYVEHMRKMFGLLGESVEKSSADANRVMAIETRLAQASQDLVTRRDPINLYHKMKVGDLAAITPVFAWDRYFVEVDSPRIEALNVVAPDFFKRAQELLVSVPIDDWKTYLRWHLVHAQAPVLPSPFVTENFDFFGHKLMGAKELKPRWKRCVALVDNDLGEALGQRYVEKTFGEQGKKRMLEMVGALERALKADIETLPWMTPATRKQALAKLAAIANKIGYPDQWRDYSKLRIIRGDILGNHLRARGFEFRRRLAKIGKPVDRKEWITTAPTVNAYYNPQLNDINFPAGILQPPFFDPAMDDAVNFGAIGVVIGHELTHGFDDEGRHFDAQGNMRDWWTQRDAKEFERRAACFVEEYGHFVATAEVKLNGKLTLGENTADNGGLRVAVMALQGTLAGAKIGPIDGFTPEQRVFLGFGQIWCQKVAPESRRMLALVDPHSPGRYRVNGVVVNMPEFQNAFGCEAGQPMVSAKPCRVW